MARFRLDLEYVGTRYSGWQAQKNARTVQGALHEAVARVSGRSDYASYGSGRTDAGVHALHQVATLMASSTATGSGQGITISASTGVTNESLFTSSGLCTFCQLRTTFTMTVAVADHWLGISTDWNDPQNWNSGQVPDSVTSIIIPALPFGGHFPIMDNGSTVHCKDLLIQTEASVSLGENDHLIIHGN